MKKTITKYKINVKKKTEKLLKKMFGYKDISQAITEEMNIIRELEKNCHKTIDSIEFKDVRNNLHLMILYCKYKTLDSILDTYQDVCRIYIFGNDYINEVNRND